MNFSYPALSCMQLGRFAADGLWTPLQAKHRPFSSIGTRNHFRQEQLTILIPEAARELACNQSRPTLGTSSLLDVKVIRSTCCLMRYAC